MGWFGGKGGDTPAMPTMAPPPQQDNSAEMMMMVMEMMGGMAATNMAMSQQQQPQLPSIPQVPEVMRAPIIDWTEKQEQLAAKSKADYNVDQARRKGRMKTILTSPLLDEEDASVTGSVLATNARAGNQ